MVNNEELNIQNSEEEKEEETAFRVSLPKSGEKECYIGLRKSLIKLLYMIEEERENPDASIKLWFYSLMLDLVSSNDLCHNKLTKVVIKIHSLYDKDQYKNMTHQQIKRQIFESKGILDYLIKELNEEEKSSKVK